jgi:tetratricopeptide (TPR) repeat protein
MDSRRYRHEKANSQLAGYYEQQARAKYEMLTSRDQSDQARALGYFGLGLLAYRQYRRENLMSPRPPETPSPSTRKLEEAHQHFRDAIKHDSKLSVARTGVARIYEARGCLERAISEFQQARQSAEDQASRRWIDEQIEKLKDSQLRERQEVPPGEPVENRRSWLSAVFGGAAEREGCS